MEQPRSRELPRFFENWLNVQTKIEYSGSTPTHIVFTYLENDHLMGGAIVIEPGFDINQIYGGFMAWTGRYETATDRLVAVQISSTGSWHSFDAIAT
ncbi:hypothetical protein EOL96_02245 [Candidatus Saccharibacteria bacterium]|nr:hypothetical protein [Candidatus Saccharibacteria bacterium]